MNTKVYLVYGDFEADCCGDIFDYHHEFMDKVCLSKESARKAIEDIVLQAYYEACDSADYDIMREEQLGAYYDRYDYLQFDVTEDLGDKITYEDRKGIHDVYYEEYDAN